MYKIKVKRNFKRFANAKLVAFARNVAQKLTSNAAFPTPDVAPSVILAEAQTLSDYIVAAIKGSKYSTDVMLTQSAKLKAILETEAAYVDRIAMGDIAKIDSAGFEITGNNKVTRPLPDAVLIKKAVSIRNGVIEIEFAPLRQISGIIGIACEVGVLKDMQLLTNAVSIQSIAAQQNTVIAFGNGHKMTINGLKSNVRYEVILFAFNANGKGANSNMVSVMVQ